MFQKLTLVLSTLILSLLLLTGCGSKPAKPTAGPLKQSDLKIFTYGKPRDELEKKMRFVHGRQLSNAIADKNWFGSVGYMGDGKDIAGSKTTLRITFLYATQGERQFPLEAKVHYILEKDGKSLFNKVYQVKATQFNAASVCQNCGAVDVALKLLERQVLPELQLELNKI